MTSGLRSHEKMFYEWVDLVGEATRYEIEFQLKSPIDRATVTWINMGWIENVTQEVRHDRLSDSFIKFSFDITEIGKLFWTMNKL